MSDAALAVQTAVKSALDTGLSDPVYDKVPASPTYPFVTIGSDKQEDWSAEGVEGEQHTLMIHSWSQSSTLTEIKNIMKDIKDSLHLQALSVTGHNLVYLKWDSSETELEEDGTTIKGTQKFKAVTQEN